MSIKIRTSQNMDYKIKEANGKVSSSVFTANPTRAVHNWQSNLDREIEAVTNERHFSKNLTASVGFCNPTSKTELANQ